jgi:molybdopterin/thiamine biosynthesis adenylyltransferase
MSSVQVDTSPSSTFSPVLVSAKKSSLPHQALHRWSYDEAFKRNRGLITEEEQEKLRNCRVAIAGMGGVGGVHLVTLVRLGIGKFTIADPDVFEVSNFNRQYGATISNIGRNKAEVMAEIAREINPDVELDVLPERIDESNIDKFLYDVDLFIDGLDFFAIDARRLVFRQAAERSIWAITSGPIGCSVAWLSFDPKGMQFDEYFDLRDDMDPLTQLISFAVGLAPQATHRSYIDLTHVDIARQQGPSASLACQLATGVAAAETVKILLGRGTIRPVPCYGQFDAYTQRTKLGRLLRGNRDLRQRFKRAWLKRQLAITSNR